MNAVQIVKHWRMCQNKALPFGSLQMIVGILLVSLIPFAMSQELLHSEQSQLHDPSNHVEVTGQWKCPEQALKTSLAIGEAILDFVERLESNKGDIKKQNFLSELEQTIGTVTGHTVVSRDVIGLSDTERKAVKSVDFSPLILRHVAKCDFSQLENSEVLDKARKLKDRLFAASKRQYEVGSGDASRSLVEVDEVGWATWTKVGVWTAGIALAIPTGGVSLGVASGVNMAVGGVDVGVHMYNGDITGAELAAGSMIVGAVIPTGGAATSAALDIGSDVAVDMAFDGDVINQMVESTVDFAQGQAQAPIIETGLTRSGVGNYRFKYLAANQQPLSVFSLSDFREMLRLSRIVTSRRSNHWCYFRFLVRRLGKEKFKAKLIHAFKSLTSMQKLNIEEKGLVRIFEQVKHFGHQSLSEIYDKKLATCIGKKAMWMKMKDMSLERRKNQEVLLRGTEVKR